MSKKEQETTDIFLWANQTDAIKNDLFVELFFVNKNFTPYRVNVGDDLQQHLNAYFLYDVINTVNLGGGTGMSVHDMTYNEEGDHILPRTDLDNVGRAALLIDLIENHSEDIVYFSEEEHEMKRMSGVIARYTHKTDRKIKFHIAKTLPTTTMVNGAAAVEFADDKLTLMKPDIAFKLPIDNQVLIVENDIFAFNLSKFEKLFKFSIRENALLKAKGTALDKNFKLSFPDLINEVSFLAEQSKTSINKLLKVDTDNLMSQEQVVNTADNLGIELMTDDSNAIIIMDGKDLNTFLDIVNDNFVEGSSTGKHYLATSKRPFEAADDRA